MAFPEEIITFEDRMNMDTSDYALVKQYQEALQNQDIETANEILIQIPNYQRKIISPDYLNSIAQTVMALELYFLEKYSPAIVVSSSQPVHQEETDMWFQITGTNTTG